MRNSDSASISWRTAAAPPGSQASSLAWPGTGQTERGPRRFCRTRLLLAWLTLFSVVAVMIYVVLWLRPVAGTCLVLVGAGYEDNLAVPHNHHGMEGLRALADLGGAGSGGSWLRPAGLRVLHRPRSLVKVEEWDRGLRTIPEKTVLLFISMHGGADREGAYLLPHRAFQPLEPGKPELDRSKLRLETVLDRLAQMPRWQQVVLFLDATAIDASWHGGLIHNGFARELDRLDERITAIPNLIVISASGPDQRSWVSEEQGLTAFAHAVLRGLQGEADDDRDGRITALEVYNYVQRRVERWAATNRDAYQSPVLYPRGQIGRDRAKQVKLGVSAIRSARREDVTSFQPPPELVLAWKAHEQLARQVPFPATYAAGLWRHYRTLLLRCESLAVAGEGEIVRGLFHRLHELEAEIRRAHLLALGSMGTTLAMPSAVGWTPLGNGALTKAMDQLWEADPKERAQRWQAIQNSFAPASDIRLLQQLRLRLIEQVVERTAQDPSAQLDHAVEMLRLLEDPTSPRPAEAHFLVMLQRDLPKQDNGVPPDLLQLALRVRLLAEQAALGISPKRSVPDAGLPYAPRPELVLPWIQTRIEEADQVRRSGQDLLFSSARLDRERARTLLHKAEALYRTAQEEAAIVQGALAVRDQALADLPWYAEWVARRYTGDPQRLQQTRELRQTIQDLLHKTHVLADLLEATPPRTRRGETARSGLEDQLRKVWGESDTLRRSLLALEIAYQRYRRGLSQGDNPDAWRDTDDALVVPFADAAARLELLARRSRIGRRLLVGTNWANDSSPRTEPDTEGSRERAAAQGLLALATLGQPVFDSVAGAGRETFADVQHRLQNFRLEEKWWRPLIVAGDEIGQRWQRLPAAIRQLTTPEKQPTSDQRVQAARQADRLQRLVDGAGNAQLTRNGTEMNRQLHWQRLLLWQGQRTWLDHWFSDDPGREPYFRAAGQVFLDDARRIDPSAPGVRALQEQLARSGRLQLRLTGAPGMLPEELRQTSQPTLHMTTESRFPITTSLVAADSKTPLPPGLPLLWLELGPGVEAVNAEDLQPRARSQDETKPPTMTTVLCSSLLEEMRLKPPDTPEAGGTTLTTRALFRGQRLELQMKLQLHPLAELARVQHPQPQLCNLAVRSPKVIQEQHGVSTGSLAIVLDCSGSMGVREGEDFAQKAKYAEATAALRQMLPKIPRGSLVSLWVFGQAVGTERTVAKAEETIRRLIPPTRWNPDDAEKIQKVMAQIEYPALEPWNESPLVRTMLRAAREDLANAQGSKTLLVLTDGMDNRIAGDTEFNPDRKDVPTLLAENLRDIDVRVVAFKVPGKEQEVARQQFRSVEQLPLPGKYYEITSAADLVITLQEALQKVLPQRMRFWVDGEDNRPVAGAWTNGLDISSNGANDRWLPGGLAPGEYKVRTQAGQRIVRSVIVNPTDLLLLELAPRRVPELANPVLDFRRVLWAATDFPWKPRVSGNGWQLAALQNQLIANRSGQLLLTLERELDLQPPTIQQVKAATVWLEVSAGDGISTRPFSQRSYYLPGYPAPAWSVDVPHWPRRGSGGLERPRVKAWWSPYREPSGVRLERGHHFTSPLELINRPLKLDSGMGLLESVAIEDRLVETHPATRDIPAVREKKSCLVVRLRYPPGDPGWVRLLGLELGGEEHYWFTSARKCTAVFWPVTAEQAERLLQTIEIVSLADFKKKAEENNYHLKLDNLPEPQAGDLRPLPPVDLWKLERSAIAVPILPTAPAQAPGRQPPSEPFLPPPPRPANNGPALAPANRSSGEGN